MRIAWREGRKSEAAAWLTVLKNDTVHWTGLSPTIRAKVLCFERASSWTVRVVSSKRRALVEEAHVLDPAEPQARLRALIAYRDTGPEVALTLLQGQETLRAATCMRPSSWKWNRAAECFAVLDFAAMSLALPGQGLTPNAENFRIRALAIWRRNKWHRPISISRKRAPWSRAGNAYAILLPSYSTAVLSSLWRYRTTCSRGLNRSTGPCSNATMRVSSLSEKLPGLRELADMPERESEEGQILATWHLACLLNDPDRQDEALASCRMLLQTEAMHYRAIAWVVVRNLDVGSSPEHRCPDVPHPGEQGARPPFLALVGCYFVSDQAPRAIELLQETRALFTRRRLTPHGRSGMRRRWP